MTVPAPPHGNDGRAGVAPPDGETNALDLNLVDVAKVYEDGPRPVAALGPLSLRVARGEFVAVLGPSGSGKSTLLRLVAGLLAPSQGAIEVTGRTADEARRAHAYGIVFQRPVLYAWRTVAGNVALPLELAGMDAAPRDARVAEALTTVGLADRADARPWQLSGGMQQRAALARALVGRPRLLLMDEPFGSLDEVTRERLQEELRRIGVAANVTVLFVTHDIDEAVFLADRLAVLTWAPGRVAAEIEVPLGRDRPADLRSAPEYQRIVSAARAAARAATRGEP
jgi:NitT/TauT family transport system ATP-binding protein